MIYRWALPVAGLMLFAAACAPTQTGDDNRYNDSIYQEGTTQEGGSRFIANRDGAMRNVPGVRAPNVRQPDFNRSARGQNEIGFVRYNQGDTRTTDRGVRRPDVTVDRNTLASQIGYLVTAYPQISDAVVLVTDDVVFVGVEDAEGKKLDAKTVDQVRRTALSVTPRYYRVRVTDDDHLLRRITEIGEIVTNGRHPVNRDDLSDLLRRMGDDTPIRGTGVTGVPGGRTNIGGASR